MQTALLIASRYNGNPLIPLNTVCTDFFPHMTPEKLYRKITEGSIQLPVVRIEPSQKAAKSVHVQDLANYIDAQRQISLESFKLMHS